MAPKMTVSHSRSGANSVHSSTAGTFTGDVWLDPIMNTEVIKMANVNFAPCARTNWHSHEGGQFLHVIAGSGWICDKGGEPRRIIGGDYIWCPPGTTHWHGADNGSYMVHQAVSHGKTTWHDPVTDEEYGKKK